MRMDQYESFRHESKRLHAVRLAHLVYPTNGEPSTWEGAAPRRKMYQTRLGWKWNHLVPYSILKAEVRRVYFLNPADLGRWGGDFLPWRIGDHHRSYMMPTTLIFTATSDEEVDSKLRDAFCVPKTDAEIGQVEALSWFGYSSKPPAINPPFQLLGTGTVNELKSLFTQMAFIFLQHQSIDILTDVTMFFNNLDVITAGTWTGAHHGTRWTPLLCGLLKGNIDGFVLLGKQWVSDAAFDTEAEELISHLTDRALRKKGDGFWTSVSPVAVYFASASENDLVVTNLELLHRLRLPVKGD